MLERGLKVVFCGTAVGPTSAQVGAYYAGPGNQFWDVLFRIGATPRRLRPDEFKTLPGYGIGLTDLAKTQSGTDRQICEAAYDVDALRSKVGRFRPKALAFTSKNAAKKFYGRSSVTFGRQPEPIQGIVVFVLPSTSGSNRGHYDESHWRDLVEFVGSEGRGQVLSHEHAEYSQPPDRRAFDSPSSRAESGANATVPADPLAHRAIKVDALIIRYFEETGEDQAKAKDLMPFLVQHGAFLKDHAEGLPLRQLCRDLYAQGRLSLMTTAHFDQKTKNKSWYFLPPVAPRSSGR